MSFKSVLKPEDSIVAGLATAGLVYGVYNGALGSIAEVQSTPSGHPALAPSLTKAGYTSLVLVAGVALMARDPNIVILGGAMIIAEELHYRHAIETHPDTGQPAAPTAAAYAPVEDVTGAQPYGGQPYMAENAQIG